MELWVCDLLVRLTFYCFVDFCYSCHNRRYIVTNRGMHAMYEKYRTAAFGRCPHVFCQGQPVLPVGLSDLPRNYTVNVFCPRCHGLFFPKSTRQANIDGAYFGTTFPHLYLMTHPVRFLFRSRAVVPFAHSRCFASHALAQFFSFSFKIQDMVPSKPSQSYVPRVYGFRVNEQSLFYRNREDDQRDQQQLDAQTRQSRRSRRGHGRK
jgi:casein kinase II subunit beta